MSFIAAFTKVAVSADWLGKRVRSGAEKRMGGRHKHEHGIKLFTGGGLFKIHKNIQDPSKLKSFYRDQAKVYSKHFPKKASFGETHRDGTSFEGHSQAIDPVMYNKTTNPSANPSFDPVGGKKAKNKVALNVALGLDKLSALRDDTARGVSEGLEKEYNGTDPARNADDAEAQKEVFKRHLKAKRGK